MKLTLIVVEVDVENQRISLGMKQLNQDPWEDIDRLYKLGDVIKEKLLVLLVMERLLNSTTRLMVLCTSAKSEERIEKVKDHLSEGQEVTARVIKIDKEERRIGLSIKAADYDEDALAKKLLHTMKWVKI